MFLKIYMWTISFFMCSLLRKDNLFISSNYDADEILHILLILMYIYRIWGWQWAGLLIFVVFHFANCKVFIKISSFFFNKSANVYINSIIDKNCSAIKNWSEICLRCVKDILSVVSDFFALFWGNVYSYNNALKWFDSKFYSVWR